MYIVLLSVKCLSSAWGLSVHFQFLVNLYLEKQYLVRKQDKKKTASGVSPAELSLGSFGAFPALDHAVLYQLLTTLYLLLKYSWIFVLPSLYITGILLISK